MTQLRTLIVEDRLDDAELLVAALVRAGFTPQWTRAYTMPDVIAGVQAGPDVVISDYSLPGMDALDVLRTMRDLDAHIPVIVVSGVMDEQTCVESLRLGAADYLLKDRLVRLGTAVEQALSRSRLEAEARRAREEERVTMGILRGLVANAPAAICVESTDGRRLLSNPSFDRLNAARASTGRPGVPGQRGGPEERPTDVQPSGADEREEDFGDRTYLSVRYPVASETGEVFARGAIHLDITRQKRVESDLESARAELQERANDLRARNVELQELDQLKSQFVACVSHELRTPLTSICGYTELLAQGVCGPLPERGREAIEVIDRNTRRLLRLIEDLLVLSRIDDCTHAMNEQRVEIADLLAAATSVLLPAVKAASLTLTVDVPADLPSVLGDPDHLERVMFNLISNAVKFSHPGGTVTVRGGIDRGCLVLTVEDSGIGIPSEELPHVFSRFHRGQVARQRAIPGTGLGLAVVQGIVERHHGEVGLESVPGQGTRVEVRLPVTGPAVPAQPPVSRRG